MPAEQGVWTDKVIRSYRSLGIDLHQFVHMDIRSNFTSYPNHTKRDERLIWIRQPIWVFAGER